MNRHLPPAGWQAPEEPEVRRCGCNTGLIAPIYIEPGFWDGNLLKGTGIWTFPSACRACQLDADSKRVDVERDLRVLHHLDEAGFAPRHKGMLLERFRMPESEALRQAVDATKAGHANLFIFGDPGNGKTHLAAALLRHRICMTAASGYFCIVPEMMAELRLAARKHQDIELIRRYSSATTLVLDDLGVERSTSFAMETLYLLFNRWYNDEKKGLIITSNKDLDWLAKNLDDRISSRIAEMSRVLHFTGPDLRLPS